MYAPLRLTLSEAIQWHAGGPLCVDIDARLSATLLPLRYSAL
jgi:hypothetical protein